MTRVRTVAHLGLALAFLGCSPDDASHDPASPSGAPTEGGYALLVLTHQYAEAGIEVSGQVMTYRGRTRTGALHALALPEQAWLTGPRPDEGTCALVSAGTQVPDGATSIDLLNVGELAIQPPEPLNTPLRLAPRDFPRITFTVSGVVYDAVAPQKLPYLAPGLYQVDAPGDELGPLHGEVEAATPTWIGGHGFEEGGLRVQIGGAGPATVMLSRDVGSITVGLTCQSADDELLVPEESLRQLGAGPAQLVVARVSTGSLQLDGLDDADLLFVSRDAADVHIPEAIETDGAAR